MYETTIPIDFTTKDYEGFLQLMKGAIPDLLPAWTDTSESDFGIVILQLAAYGLHILSYYQDKGINENFLPTARNRESVIKLCRFLGYELAIQEASTVSLTFTKYADALGLSVTIPAGTKVSTDPLLGNPIYFETLADLTINAGVLTGTVSAKQGFSYVSEFIGLGDNSVNQEVIINKENVLINDMEVFTVENGVNRQWTKVSDFLSSTSTSRHYKAVIEGNFYTKIIFGNGTNGRKVSANSPIYSTYTVGGGIIGNVGAGKIVYLYDNMPNIESVTNPAPATGGLEFESIETARVKAPKVFATMDRAVTKADFCALAEKVPGVAKATLVETFNPNGDVILYLIPSSYTGNTSSAVKTAVENVITPIMVLNAHLVIQDTEYVGYFVTADVVIHEAYANATKKTEIEAKLQEMLSPQHFSHGESISTSYIEWAIHQVAGVKKATVSAYIDGATPTEELDITDIQFLKLDTLTVNVTGGS